LIIFFFIIIN